MPSKFRAALGALLVLLPLAAGAGEFDLAVLLDRLAQVRSAHAGFSEKHYLKLLDKPLESSGELAYQAPAHLEKHTLEPKDEALILDGGTLTVVRKGRRQMLKLQDYPDIAVFIDSIRATLAGDRRALEAAYRVELGGRYEHWTLELTPLSARMLAKVSKVRLAGARAELRQIEIVQADGDRSLMSIDKAAP